MWKLDEIFILLLLLAAFLAAIELGFRPGMRRCERSDDSDKSHIASLQASVLGLLALLLGFTFFLSVSRFDARKALVVDEANAIGTTYLRTSFLAADQRETSRRLLREYVSARLAFYAAGIDPARLARANDEAASLERQLWALAAVVAAQDPRSVSTGLFIESLNDVIDLREKRQVALDNHVPEPVLYLLLIVSLVSMALLGFGCGLTRRRRFASNATFVLLIVLVFGTILDIDRPRRGLIKVSQESLTRLAATMK